MIAVWISAECAVDKSGKLNRYGGDLVAEGLSIFGATQYIPVGRYDIMPRWHCGCCHSLPRIILLNMPLQRGDSPSSVECI